MEKQEKKWGKVWGGLRTYQYVLLVALAGLVLLLWPQRDREEKKSQDPPAASPVQTGEDQALEALRESMETILSRIDGVGELRLMLTLETNGEKKLAGDSALRYSGSTASPDDYERTSETVVLSQAGSGQEVVVIQELSPRFRGALVVCDGGDVASVRLSVIEAVSALTGLGTDKIAVVKSSKEVSGG